MLIDIPDWVADDGIIPYVAGYLRDFKLFGESALEITRSSYRPGVPKNLHPIKRILNVPVPPEGISQDFVLECCRSAFSGREPTLVERARDFAGSKLPDVGAMIIALVHEVERLERAAAPNVTYDDKRPGRPWAGIHGDD